MANRGIMRDGLQELCIVSKQENLAEGNSGRKVVNLHQKHQLMYARPDREQIRGVTVDANEV